MRNLIVIVALLAIVASPALAHTSASASGNVRGTNTVDNVFTQNPLDPGTYDYTLTATGRGTNRLKFRVYVWFVDWEGARWVRAHTARLTPSNSGASYSSSFTVADIGEGARRVKFVFSRKIGTKRIDYTMQANRR